MLLEYGLIECTDKWNVDTEVSIDLGEEMERLVSFHGGTLLVVASEIEFERHARHFCKQCREEIEGVHAGKFDNRIVGSGLVKSNQGNCDVVNVRRERKVVW
jgi:hypothetical protein